MIDNRPVRQVYRIRKRLVPWIFWISLVALITGAAENVLSIINMLVR
jgi:hypothetical protein